MNKTEITEQLPEDVRNSMEDAVFDMEQSGDGFNCAKDAANALNELRKRDFFKFGDRVVMIEGPLNHYNHKLGKYTWDKHHFVGQINDKWVVDIACEPGGRIFYNMPDYMERSGVKLTE